MVNQLLRRSTLESKAVSFDPDFTASEEYNLFMRLLTVGTVCSVPEILGAWRLSSGSLTDRQAAKLHDERRATLDRIRADAPALVARHPAAIAEAYARGSYYEARYMMQQGERQAAFRLLWGERTVHWRYGLLALATVVPGVWALAHSRTAKVRILPRLN